MSNQSESSINPGHLSHFRQSVIHDNEPISLEKFGPDEKNLSTFSALLAELKNGSLDPYLKANVKTSALNGILYQELNTKNLLEALSIDLNQKLDDAKRLELEKQLNKLDDLLKVVRAVLMRALGAKNGTDIRTKVQGLYPGLEINKLVNAPARIQIKALDLYQDSATYQGKPGKDQMGIISEIVMLYFCYLRSIITFKAINEKLKKD